MVHEHEHEHPHATLYSFNSNKDGCYQEGGWGAVAQGSKHELLGYNFYHVVQITYTSKTTILATSHTTNALLLVTFKAP